MQPFVFRPANLVLDLFAGPCIAPFPTIFVLKSAVV